VREATSSKVRANIRGGVFQISSVPFSNHTNRHITVGHGFAEHPHLQPLVRTQACACRQPVRPGTENCHTPGCHCCVKRLIVANGLLWARLRESHSPGLRAPLSSRRLMGPILKTFDTAPLPEPADRPTPDRRQYHQPAGRGQTESSSVESRTPCSLYPETDEPSEPRISFKSTLASSRVHTGSLSIH
jgi:hypothetical protein